MSSFSARRLRYSLPASSPSPLRPRGEPILTRCSPTCALRFVASFSSKKWRQTTCGCDSVEGWDHVGAFTIPIRQREALRSELVGKTVPAGFSGSFEAQMRQLVESASPSAAMEASIQHVERDLRVMAEAVTGESLRTLNVSQLASRGVEIGLIDARLVPWR